MTEAFHFDDAAAQRVVDFFAECLVHVKGEKAGQPFILEPWQERDIIRPLFGWKQGPAHAGPCSCLRRYRTAYVEVPKKNGKSALCSGIALYLLTADGEEGAEIYSAAGDREQAEIVFGVAKSMVAKSPELRKRVRPFKRALVYYQTGSSYKVLSADVETKHGFDIHGLIFDELHVQRSRAFWDTLTTGNAARRQPVMIAITTAGWDRNSICWEQHDYAVKVRDGIIEDPQFLPVIYAAAEEDDWQDEATWRKANPNYGVSVNPDILRGKARQAAESPAAQNTFKRLHLNIWTAQAERWLEQRLWDACDGPARLEDLHGLACFGGLDLAATTDIAALALLFPFDDVEEGELEGPEGSEASLVMPGRRYIVIPRFWIPRDNIAKPTVKRDPRLRDTLSKWVQQGLITATPGDVIDYDVIRRDINVLGEQVQIKEIAFDRWGARQLATQLQGDGFTMIEMGQGFASMSAPTKALEQLLRAGRLAHGGNPVLRWMFGNVAVAQDAAGNLKPDKARSSEKIDGIVAMIMALDRGGRQPTEPEYVSRWA